MDRAAHYRRQFTMGGRLVTLERRVPNGQPVRVEGVRSRIRGYSSEEIAGGIDVGSRKVILLAEDVPADWLPLRANDAVIADGLTMRFKTRPDDQTHRDGEKLFAIEGEASGS